MQRIGFSTGALAYGDFRKGVELQRRNGINAIELSALRESELDGLIAALDDIDLEQFEYCSFHAPSSLEKLSERELVSKLSPIAKRKIPIIVHPDIIHDAFYVWRELDDMLLLENMDSRKAVCRTAAEMKVYFQELPTARFCFDIGHARQMDPTMTVAYEFLRDYRDRLAEVHISEVNWECKHRNISTSAALAFHETARWLPKDVPVIIESVIKEDEIDRELATVRRCLDFDTPYFSNAQQPLASA